MTYHQLIYSPGPVKCNDSHICFAWVNHFVNLGIPSYLPCHSFNCTIQKFSNMFVSGDWVSASGSNPLLPEGYISL